MGATSGFADFGSAFVTLFCTTCVEKSASVARVASPCTMTSLRARGAMVSTYLSVLVTVLMAHTDRTDTGMRIEASTTSTHAEIRRGRWPRRGLSFLILEFLIVELSDAFD